MYYCLGRGGGRGGGEGEGGGGGGVEGEEEKAEEEEEEEEDILTKDNHEYWHEGSMYYCCKASKYHQCLVYLMTEPKLKCQK